METSCTKNIWVVVFNEGNSETTQRVLAYSLTEVLSFFNDAGRAKIIKIEKTKEQATYKY